MPESFHRFLRVGVRTWILQTEMRLVPAATSLSRNRFLWKYCESTLLFSQQADTVFNWNFHRCLLLYLTLSNFVYKPALLWQNPDHDPAIKHCVLSTLYKPFEEKKRWVFIVVPQNCIQDELMGSYIIVSTGFLYQSSKRFVVP